MSNGLKIKKRDMKLTPEMIKKIKAAGLLGFNLDSVFPYVPKSYRVKNSDGEYEFPKTTWPVFELKGIDGVRSAQIEDGLKGEYRYQKDNGDVSVAINSGASRIETLVEGIKSWKNYLNEDFDEIEAPNEITEECLRYFSPSLQIELANAITEQTKLNDEELSGLE